MNCSVQARIFFSFDHAMTFECPDNIISMKEALDIWFSSYKIDLNYVNVPFSSPNHISTNQLYTYVLGYSMVQKFNPEGIIAKTGEFINPFIPRKNISYPPDLDGHKDREIIEELIIHGITYADELLNADKSLTQIDLLTLLYRAAHHRFIRYRQIESVADTDIYGWAINKDIITEEEKDEQAIITRLELIKRLIHAVELKDIAQIPGIYRTSFLDEHDIPDSMIGYAALAQGVELIEFSEDGMLHPNHIVTRGEAMLILYDLMTR